MTTLLRIAFAGTPEFSVPALTALAGAHATVVGVWTRPDRPAGRGRKSASSPVKQCARELGLPVFQPESLKTEAAQREFKACTPDVMVVVAYGLLLPPAWLAIPRYGCINVHASLLPRWRGAAPIQRALLAGDGQTGVSLMRMQAGLDTGPVYAVRATPITPEDTAGSLHDRLAPMGAELLLETLMQLPRRTPAPQDAAGVTYAAKLTRTEARLDWLRPAAELARAVRAFNPWPMAWTVHDGEPLRILKALALEMPTALPPGTIAVAGNQGIDVASGRGVLRITELQAAGRRAMPAGDFARARALAGVRFGE